VLKQREETKAHYEAMERIFLRAGVMQD